MPKGKFKNPVERAAKIAKSKRRGRFFICLVCGSRFWRKPSAIKKGNNKFCSLACYYQWQRGKQKTISNPCDKHRENNPNWRGGIKSINDLVRSSKEYQEWRQKVFKRDNWTCQKCGNRSKRDRHVIIHAHHIKPFAVFPELRLVVDNGKTLCKKCHDSEVKGKGVFLING